MAKINRTLSGRNQLTVVVPPPSPSLVRTRSGSNLSTIITTPERSSRRFSSSERQNNEHRSKSTSKVRTHNKEGINTNPTLLATNKFQEKKKSRDGFGKFLQNGVSPDNNGVSKRATLPSAWALSPGRGSLNSPIGFESPAKASENSRGGGGGGGGVGSGVAKVLKYFKQKKVSSMQDEVYHRFRILYNRHLQWRFVNARTEVAMTNVKNVAEIHLFSEWLEILMQRKMIIQKRMELQKVKYIIKLYHILKGQLSLLTEWEKLKKINQDSIGKLTRKLSAMSTTLPLTHGIMADTEAIFEALNTATEVMENIKALIVKFQTQIEKILYQVTELTTTSKEEEVCLQKLSGIVPIIATLLENEKSIQVRLIQTKMESNHNDNYPCIIAQSCTSNESPQDKSNG